MDVLTFISHVLLYGLGAATLYLVNKRVEQFQKKIQDENLAEMKAELDHIKKRISELSVKVGFKDSFKN